MKREAILKIILVLIVGVILFAKPVNVVAASSDPADINDIFGWEDQTGSITDTDTNTNTSTNTSTNTDTNTSTNTSTSTPSTTTPSTNTNTSTSTSTNTNTTTSTSTSTSTNTKTDLPKAGLVEDTMMIVAIIALIAVAIFAFVKVSDYSNI